MKIHKNHNQSQETYLIKSLNQSKKVDLNQNQKADRNLNMSII
jgi:hypothetical protein